ncbi:hypothetical protein GOODEAATRI_023473 [Goodea atripinnis]|uniref:Uncharacterized protein n=1 Tax=Goodea atripinnis TaxID=208336 RepID=A0ABV0MUS7_9TELE
MARVCSLVCLCHTKYIIPPGSLRLSKGNYHIQKSGSTNGIKMTKPISITCHGDGPTAWPRSFSPLQAYSSTSATPIPEFSPCKPQLNQPVMYGTMKRVWGVSWHTQENTYQIAHYALLCVSRDKKEGRGVMNVLRLSFSLDHLFAEFKEISAQ